VDVTVCISAQIHHPRQFLRTPPALTERSRGHVLPHMFINAQRGHPSEPGLVGVCCLKEGADRFPNGSPTSAQLPAEPVDGSMFTTQLADRPVTSPHRHFGTRPCDLVVLLHEGTHRAPRDGTHPPSFAPHNLDGTTPGRRINQCDVDQAVPVGHNTAHVAAHQHGFGLHRDRHSARLWITFHAEHVETGQTDQDVTTSAIRATRPTTRSRLEHRRGPHNQKR